MIDRIIANNEALVPNDHADFPLLREAIKDLQEFRFICDVFADRLASEPLRSVLLRSLSDAPLRNDRAKGHQSAGRDAQFELFVGAACERAGLRPERMGDGKPDWLARSLIRQWTVEVKRIKSKNFERGLERAIRDASTQIEQSDIGGIAFVDVGASVFPQGPSLEGRVSGQKLQEAVTLRAEYWSKRFRRNFIEWVGGRPVGVVVLHDYVIHPIACPDRTKWGHHASWDFYLIAHHSQSERYSEFVQLFQCALPQLDSA